MEEYLIALQNNEKPKTDISAMGNEIAACVRSLIGLVNGVNKVCERIGVEFLYSKLV